MSNLYCFHQTPIGRLLLVGSKHALNGLYFPGTWTEEDVDGHVLDTQHFTEVTTQLDEYFQKERTTFDLPLEPPGTAFQKKVWRQLVKIPYGTTSSYGEIAQRIHNPKGCRAVGMANGKNPIPIIIPCHRVIGKNGTLTGFAAGLEIKQQLLDLEKRHPQN